MYDSDTSAVTSALRSTSTAVFSEKTIANILALTSNVSDPAIKIDNTPTIAADGKVTFAADTELGFVNVAASDTALSITGNTSTIILGGTGSANLVVGNPNDTVVSGGAPGAQHAQQAASGTPERVIVTTAQADKITIVDFKNSYVLANNGDTIVGGHGYDTVVAAEGDSTVQGGGHTIVQLTGHDSDYTVTVNNGHAVVSNATTKQDIDVSKLQYIQLDDNDALVLAANSKQAALAHLYEALLGRDADFGGLEYYFKLVDNGASLSAIADGFLKSAEYTGSALSDADFVSSLYQNALGRAADAGGATYWEDVLEHGASRADVAAAFANAAANHADNGEVTVVGSVTVVTGIV